MDAPHWNGDDDRDLGLTDPQSHEDDERDNCDWDEDHAFDKFMEDYGEEAHPEYDPWIDDDDVEEDD